MNALLANIWRLLMIVLWAVLLINLVHPFSGLLKYIMNAALLFLVITHGLQLIFLRISANQRNEKISYLSQLRIFFFGAVDALSWQKLKTKIDI